MSEITLPDGSKLSSLAATTCDEQLAGPYHDWIYLKARKSYKCRRCGSVVLKEHLKTLTD